MASAGDDYPSVLRMSAPLMVSFYMRSAFTFVDTAFAATIGDAAVGAIGLTFPFEFLLIACWVGLSTGLTSSLTRAMGAHEGNKISQYLKSTWVLVSIVAPAFLLLGACIWFIAPRLDLDPDIYRAFRVYGTVLIGGSAFTAFWSVIPDSVVKAHQDTRSTMWAGICSNVANVTLNTVFLFVFHWGVFGIALSTVLGRIAGLAYALRMARKHERARIEARQDVEPGIDPSPYWTILSLAVPASLIFGLMAGETAVINGLLATTTYAKEAIAAYSIYYRVVMLGSTAVIAISVAMLPYAARRIGAEDPDGLRKGMRQAGWFSALYAIFIVGPVLLIGAPTFAGWLGEEPLTRQYATFALRMVPLTVLVSAPFLLCRPVFEAMGRGRPGLTMAALRYLVFTIPAAWVGMNVAQGMGHPGLYGLIVALVAAAAVSSSIFAAWLRSAVPEAPEDFAEIGEATVPAEATGEAPLEASSPSPGG